MRKLIPSILVVLLVLWVPGAMAYIDPGSGSAIMSAVIGLFVAVGLAIKTYWYKLKSIFMSKNKAAEISTGKNTEEEEEEK